MDDIESAAVATQKSGSADVRTKVCARRQVANVEMRHQVSGVKDHPHRPLIMTSRSQLKKGNNKAKSKNKRPQLQPLHHAEPIEVANLDAFDEVDEILAAR